MDRSARLVLGLRARKQMARGGHADFSPTACRHDPLEVLRAAEQGRLLKLLAIKHERMAAGPFGFFRGAVPIMAADLACHPNTGITTQLCGDAHVANLGAFAAPAGSVTAGAGSGGASALAFDINDFDETIRGPFEYDLKRLATSLLLAGRDAGIKRTARRDAVLHFACRYRETMHKFSSMPVIEMARYQIHRLAEIDPMPAILAQAEHSTPQKSLKSLTEPVAGAGAKDKDEEGRRRFQSHPPLLTRVTGKEAELVLAALGPYARTLQPERRHFLAQYEPLDVAFKVVGTGSVGLRDYCVYFESVGRAPHTDPLFLQIKEETHSAYASYLADGDSHTHQGHRVVDGQRAMQLTSDPFLGYTTIEGRDYLVRQLNDHKAGLDLTKLTAASLLGYADLCGELFARGHARSGDAVTIAAYLGNSDRFDRALLSFARIYADKTEQDYAAFVKSLKGGVGKHKGAGAKKKSSK
jgi:uncharacterized protein (DUF2252 family)